MTRLIYFLRFAALTCDNWHCCLQLEIQNLIDVAIKEDRPFLTDSNYPKI